MSPTSCSRPQSLYITKTPVVIQTQKKEEDIRNFSATISQKCLEYRTKSAAMEYKYNFKWYS